MKESDLNTIIGRSIRRTEFYHKMSDESSDQKPFDGFGILNNKPLYVEAKLIKNGMYSFNFNKIEDHQYENLERIANSLNKSIGGSFYAIYMIGFFKSRDFFRVLCFSHETIRAMKEEGKKSLKKKELEAYIDSGKYLDIKYESIDMGGKKKRYQFIQNLKNIDGVII